MVVGVGLKGGVVEEEKKQKEKEETEGEGAKKAAKYLVGTKKRDVNGVRGGEKKCKVLPLSRKPFLLILFWGEQCPSE